MQDAAEVKDSLLQSMFLLFIVEEFLLNPSCCVEKEREFEVNLTAEPWNGQLLKSTLTG